MRRTFSCVSCPRISRSTLLRQMMASFIPIISCRVLTASLSTFTASKDFRGRHSLGKVTKTNLNTERQYRLPVKCSARVETSADFTSTVEIPITGLVCGGCVARCERSVLEALGEESRVSADLLSSTLTVTANYSSARIISLASVALKQAGFALRSIDERESERSNPTRGNRRILALGAALFLLSLLARNVCCGDLAMIGLQGTFPQLILFALAIAYVTVPLRKLFVSGASSLSQCTMSMNALVTLSVSLQLIVSMVGFLMPSICSPRSLETLLLLFFVDAGRVLDSSLRSYVDKTSGALSKLQPKQCTRLLVDGTEETTSVETICIGDRIRVNGGERFPVDGVVHNLGIREDARADLSVVTGETLPKILHSGDQVWAGGVNLSSIAITIVARTSAARSEIALGASSIAKALREKSDTQRLADVAASYLGKFSLAVAVAGGLAWYVGLTPRSADLASLGVLAPVMIAASVLCSACPCGLALAVPMVSMVAMTAAARRGIYFRSSAALELAASRFRLLLFDKTGTLTTGDMLVQSMVSETISSNHLIYLAASAESRSHHPVASAILRYAASLKIQPGSAETRTVVGCGVTADVSFQNRLCTVLVGSAEWISACALDLLENPRPFKEPSCKESSTCVYVLCPELGGVLGYIVLADKLAATKAQVDDLRKLNSLPRVAVLSGGTQDGAEDVARKIGITISDSSADVVMGNLKPREKLSVANSVLSTKHGKHQSRLAVGDGINDAVLLADSELSFAMGRPGYGCTPAAASVAQVAIPNGDFSLVAEALRTGRAARLAAIASLCWAAVYNIVAVLKASGIDGHFVPVHKAALSMVFSSAISLSIPIALALFFERRLTRATRRRHRASL